MNVRKILSVVSFAVITTLFVGIAVTFVSCGDADSEEGDSLDPSEETISIIAEKCYEHQVADSHYEITMTPDGLFRCNFVLSDHKTGNEIIGTEYKGSWNAYYFVRGNNEVTYYELSYTVSGFDIEKEHTLYFTTDADYLWEDEYDEMVNHVTEGKAKIVEIKAVANE